jgi:hypothetical protein
MFELALEEKFYIPVASQDFVSFSIGLHTYLKALKR